MKPTMPCKNWERKPKRKKRGMKGYRKMKVKPDPQKVRHFYNMGRKV